jgi:hypothetical protein
MTDAERLKSLEVVIDQGRSFPLAEFEKLSTSSQLSLESRLRNELEQIAGELGPEGLDVAIEHLEGLIEELAASDAPAAIVSDMRRTIERLRLRRADYN